MASDESKEYEFFIVALTKQGKLIDSYVRARSVANALDKFISQFDLSGMIVEYRFCVREKGFQYENHYHRPKGR